MPAFIWALRLMAAVVFITFGVDQLRLPGPWLDSVPAWVRPFLPGWPDTFMRIHAAGNLILGLWVLSGIYPKVSAGLAVIWMAVIVGSVFLTGEVGWRIAVRDLAITLGLLALYLAG